jgi:HD superfamily phosphodiesterase
MDCQHLIDQADQCLYLAKREGRNRVQRWDHCRTSDLLLADNGERTAKSAAAEIEQYGNLIQYPAVTAMLSALAFRDRDTAVHSARVARLCLLVGGRLMKREDLYELEIAAILHDVGKIGVPDPILRKPGPLTPEEWQIMNRQDQMGVEIVRSAFASDRIIEYIRCHHLQFANALTQSCDGQEEVLPLGARIITVCDAYDSMTHDRVYRKARTPEEAFAELYRWSGVQFDPLIVRTLERVVSEGAESLTMLMPISQSLKLGAYVEDLTAAIAARDLDALAQVTKQVAATAAEYEFEPLLRATCELESQISGQDTNLNELTRIADEILEFCRASRVGMLENPHVLSASSGAAAPSPAQPHRS